MMESMQMKSVITFMLVAVLVGCKTVGGAIDSEELADAQEAIIVDEAVEDQAPKEERHIEEVPEVLETIEASRVAEKGTETSANDVKSAPVSLDNVTAAGICSDWKSSRNHANSTYLGKEIAFSGRVTTVSQNSEHNASGNMVFIDADKTVSLGVVFKSIRETLFFSTGQNLALKGELTEIKRAKGGRCLFIINNASVRR